MTASSRTMISSLPRGHEFEPVTYTITPDSVSEYLRAVGDDADYGDRLPPLAAVALALGSLLEQVALPAGSLHTAQEVEHLRLLAAGASLTLRGRIAQRSARQGFVISVIELDIDDEAAPAIRARTTIMAPGGQT
jgi:hypothetical protein